MPPLKIYSRRYETEPNHVPFLSPWWGAPKEDPGSLHLGQFDNWAASRCPHYTMVDSPETADVFVLSIPWKRVMSNPDAKAFAEREVSDAKRLGRQIIIFFDSDQDQPIAWPAHAVVFRFSIYSDTRPPTEFSIPTFSQDFLTLNYQGMLRTREKTARPSAGFCGYAPPLGCRFSKGSAREVLRYAAYRLGLLQRRRQLMAHAPRVQAIRALRRTQGVESRFITRDQFAFNRWGVLQPGGTPESAARSRQEFVDNLNGTDYALCVRGLANCSIRFYEAISLGRIPIFVNTHCVLPYDWMVDWKSGCVWVEQEDLPRIGEILLAHHAALSADDFAAKQKLARELFEKWIRPEGFFGELHRHLKPVRQE